MSKSFKKGVGMIEIIIVSSVIVFAISGFMLVAGTYIKFALRNTSIIKAGYLLEEGMEVVKIMRDNSWTSNIASIPVTTNRYLVLASNTWNSTSTVSVIDDKYYRTINFSSAYRDANKDLVNSGTLDTDAREYTGYIHKLDKRAHRPDWVQLVNYR